MSNILSYVFCFGIWPWLLGGLLGLLLGWLLFRGKKQVGDLSIEGEGLLRTEADSLRARINELEGGVSTRDGEIGDLRAKLAAGTTDATGSDGKDDDETYALEWRNRYLAARVKYLEGRISDAPKAKPTAKKRVAKKVARPKVLYKKPTDGKPDDLKLISGVGPKLEKMLHKTGVYYFRQIANWKKADVKMVNDKLGAFPGRIERDEWVRQAKGLAKGVAAKKVPAKKAAKVAKSASPNAKYLAEVRKYDAKASAAVIDNIVKYCGIALRSRDSSLVACSQEHELNTIAKGFATKKLGMTSGQLDLVKAICEQMKGQRFKNRVTFYYLMAKKARKMSIFK